MDKKKIILNVLNQLLKSAVAIIIASVIVFITSGQITKTSDSLAQKKQLAAIISRRTETISKIRADLKLIGDNQQKIINSLPPADNIIDFIDTLTNIVNKNSLQFTYSFGTPSPYLNQNNFSVWSVDYSLKISGGLTNFISYLKDFEKINYFTTINSIYLAAPTTGWENNTSFTMSAKLYAKQQ